MAKQFFGENSMRALIQLIKADLGLKTNVADIVNTLDSEDTEKPLSAAQGKALNDKITQASTSVNDDILGKIGEANGIAPLGEDKKIDSSFLPSYVDDVVEGYMVATGAGTEEDPTVLKLYKEEAHTTEITGETGKIYVDLSTNTSYRWSGSVFVMIESGDMIEMTTDEIQSLWDSIVVEDEAGGTPAA